MTPRSVLLLAAQLGVLTCIVACSASPSPPPAKPSLAAPSNCTYAVTVEGRAKLSVAVACDRPVRGFVASEATMVDHIHAAGLTAEGARFELPVGAKGMSYEIDLAAVANESRDIDVAYEANGKLGSAWIAAVSTWVLRPEPIDHDTRATIRVEGMPFTSGMQRQGDVHTLLAREIRFATYGIFGDFSSEVLEVPGPMSLEQGASSPSRATLELVTLPGGLASTSEVRRDWVNDTARAISEFWHGFPVGHAMVVLIPTPGHEGVAHGKVVAAGGSGVAIHIGSEALRPELYGDWILVHELFHLGFPSFSGEGKWLDEGLATYFEPIIRARAGWRSPQAVWGEFTSDMVQGLAAVESTGVEKTTSFKGIYWGGAIIALLTDVQTRHRTDGKVGLEDGLLAVLAQGGNASQLWKLDRAISVIDERLGGDTLRRLADAHSVGGKPVDLPRLWRDLGVQRTGGVLVFDDEAALAPIRQAIIAPPPRP